MRILIDTHIFLWMTSDRARLKNEVLQQLDDPDNEIFFSGATSWEIGTKRKKGKLQFSGSPIDVARRIGLVELPITAEQCEVAADLPDHHRDPFDRLLIAQAQMERLVLATRDPVMARYGVRILRS